MDQTGELFSQCKTLPPTELKQLHTQIGAYLSLMGTSTTKKNHDNWILATIIEVMQKHGDIVHLAQIKRSPAYNSFCEKLPDVEAYFKKAHPNKAGQRYLFRLAVELLYQNLVEMNIVVTTTTLLAHFHRITRVLDVAFPGYYESGLLKLVVRTEASNKPDKSNLIWAMDGNEARTPARTKKTHSAHR